jgi:hypothetical protein
MGSGNVLVRLLKSKTNQFAKEEIKIIKRTGEKFCPVASILDYKKEIESEVLGCLSFLFPRLVKRPGRSGKEVILKEDSPVSYEEARRQLKYYIQ